MIIKFKTPEEKSKKIAEAIKLLPKLTTSTTGAYNTYVTPAIWTVQSPYTSINTPNTGLSSGTITTNANTVVSGSSITTTGTAITINSNGNVGLGGITTNTKISGSGLNNALGGITTGINNTGLGAIGVSTIGTSNNIYGIYGYSNIKHNILGTEVDISYLHNSEVIISLINTLGVEFWDEYTIQSGIAISNPLVYAAIEEVMKLHRRDEKLNNILGE